MCDIKNKIKKAQKSIVLIDSYVDELTLALLEEKQENVTVLVCSNNRLMLNERNVRRRKGFKAGFRYVETHLFRNMYILIDDKFLYMLSKPLRYNEKRNFWFIQILDIGTIERIRKMISDSEAKVRELYRHF